MDVAAAHDTRTLAAVVSAPFGAVGIEVADGALTALHFLPDTAPLAAGSEFARRVVAQIERYFDDPAAGFDVPLQIRGTPFQRAVWQQIAAIECGRTRTYGDIATELERGGQFADARDVPARAVGQACGDNRLPLVIPCHRVIAASGLGGFAHRSGGFELTVKRWLLEHEGALRGPLL